MMYLYLNKILFTLIRWHKIKKRYVLRLRSHKQKVPCHRRYATKILMAILVPGLSRAGPWLNSSKNFGEFIFFSILLIAVCHGQPLI